MMMHKTARQGASRSCLSAAAPAAPSLAPVLPACPIKSTVVAPPQVQPSNLVAVPSSAHTASCRRRSAALPAVAEAPSSSLQTAGSAGSFTVVIAGAGISGLTLALGLLKKGIRVLVLERDLTAVRGEGKLRGPIQVQSNALAALEAIDPDVAAEIIRNSCITGDRINGLCDGVSGDWYCKFDTFRPAVSRGLPVTRVISRITLQEILADAVIRYGGEGTILGSCHVVGYEQFKDAAGMPRVTALLEDGRSFTGDMLVGTDGIWSKIRKQLLGETTAHYSDYTCYTGISDYVPADIDMVAYRVFLGNGLYFVSSDVGEGKMQWYAFHKEPAGGEDEPGQRKARLLSLFNDWNYNVVDLIKATPEEDVLRRDIYDRAPIFSWSEGRVALMGDSAHAMQPNLGQGGCMAIEDAFELVSRLTEAVGKANAAGKAQVDVEPCLKEYERARILRVSAIHGMARMAAFMAATYKAYLGEGMGGALSWVKDYHIHHPGRVGGQAILKLTMPLVLEWVLGGNTSSVDRVRVPYCRVDDAPRHMKASEIDTFMRDDEALTQRISPDWLIVAERVAAAAFASEPSRPRLAHATVMAASVSSAAPDLPTPSSTGTATIAPPTATSLVESTIESIPRKSGRLQGFGLPPFEYKGAFLNFAPKSSTTGRPTISVGSSPHCQLVVAQAASMQAEIEQQGTNKFVLHDLGQPGGTWVNGHKLARGGHHVLRPGDHVEFGKHPAQEVFQIKWQHASYREAAQAVRGDSYGRVDTGCMSSVA